MKGWNTLPRRFFAAVLAGGVAVLLASQLALGETGTSPGMAGPEGAGTMGPQMGSGMTMGPGMMGPGMTMGPQMGSGMGPGMTMGPGMMGPGMMMGPQMGHGMMGHGMMMGPQMGHGMMGPGMMMGPHMGHGMMGHGMMGHGMMMGRQMGHGMRGPGMMGSGIGPAWIYGFPGHMGRTLSVDDVTKILERRLAWHGNERLKLGAVDEKDYRTVTVEIMTVDDSLVQRLEVDRRTGQIWQTD